MIENCIFQGNNASYYGGAISLSEVVNPLKFLNCDFIGNYTSGTNAQGNPNGIGGAISYNVTYFNNVANLSFFNCNFVDNFAQTGGGININIFNNFAEESLELEIEKSFFSNNYLVNGGLPTGASINYIANIKNQSISIKESKFVNHILSSGFHIVRVEVLPALSSANDNLNLKISDCSFIQNGMPCLHVRIWNQSIKNKLIISNTIFKENLAYNGIIRILNSMSPILDA